VSDRPFIVGLVSSFDEGPMLETAIRSLLDLDAIVNFEGPVEGHAGGNMMPPPSNVRWARGEWESDAAKRTAMVEYVHRTWVGKPVWGLWLDGDEILLWGEYLHDWIWRVEQQGDADNPVGGWPFPLVELDGSTSLCMGKLLRVDLVRRYLVSSSLIELVNGDRRTVGNVEYWNPIDGPTQFTEGDRPHWRARQPLAGEPHLQHRPILRSRARRVERQHLAEERNYRKAELDKAS
jgi:hypothetical protein